MPTVRATDDVTAKRVAAMKIPPKHSPVYVVDSSSSDPYLSGPLEIMLSADCVSIRWAGESVWHELPWYEIAIYAESPGKYREVIESLKEQAYEDGLAFGLQDGLGEKQVLSFANESGV